MEESESKRKRVDDNVVQEGIDRINDLQDDILTQIFSFLPTEDNVRASFVCTRWKPLWSPLSVLDLDCKRFCKIFKNSSQEDRKAKFTDFVNSMFARHQHQHLEELRFAFDRALLGITNPDIDNWVVSAITRGSTKLNLEFTSVDNNNGNFVELYKLPRLSCAIRSVTVLKLDLCKFVPRRYNCFESLQTVVLRNVELLKNAVNDLIDRCPVLEELHLIDCTVCDSMFDSEFDISASTSKLKCLVLDFSYGFEGQVDSVDIHAPPSLLKFKYVGDLLDNFSVGSFDDLIEADIYFTEAHFSLEHSTSLQNTIGSLCNVTTLTLCSWSLQLLGTFLYDPSELLEDSFPFSNLKYLTLHSCLGDIDLKGLHRLMRSSPSIETLSIELSPGYYPDNFWESQSVPFDCLQHLKKIEMKGFYGLKSEMEFLKYMLANALVLKKIIIYKAAFRSRCISKEQDEIDKPLFFAEQEKAIKVLLGFTRASPDAQILLP